MNTFFGRTRLKWASNAFFFTRICMLHREPEGGNDAFQDDSGVFSARERSNSLRRVRKFKRTREAMISAIPSHWMAKTCSCNNRYALPTETGISMEIRIEPSPIPVLGIPILSSRGGSTVPNKANKRPHFQNMEIWNPENSCTDQMSNTMLVPPVRIQKLFCRAGM